MSADGQPSREVAHRVFAAEFDDATLSYSESDEERAPNYVVMPTGARVNRLFAVGVLTEIETVGNEQLRARVVDPTGAFVVYAGQYQPDALATLDGLDAPEFVAVTGKARTFQPEDSDRVYTSIRPESIGTVDATVRDRWTVGTAERTLERVGTAMDVHGREERGDELRETLRADGVPEELAAGIPLAFEHYGTTPAYLGAVGDLALDTARVVAGEREEVAPLAVAPDESGEPGATPSEFDAASDAGTVAAGAATGSDAATAESATGSSATDDGSDETVEAGGGAVGESDEAAGATDVADVTVDTGDTAADTEAPVESDTTTEPAAVTGADGSDAGAGTTTTAGDVGGEAEPEESDTAADTEPDDGVDTTETSETAGIPETADTGEPAAENTEPVPDAEDAAAAGDEATDPEDAEEFELDPEERDRLETEFGTDFERGSEVDDPGEADIETPEPAESEQPDAETATADTATEDDTTATEPTDAASAVDTEPDASDTTEAETPSDATADGEPSASEPETSDASDQPGSSEADADGEDESDAEIDPDDAVMDAMEELDDGDGADREAVINAVTDEHGFESGTVEDAIQDALMNGRCYEPDDGTLKPI